MSERIAYFSPMVIIPMAMRLMGTSPGAKPAPSPVASLISLISGWLAPGGPAGVVGGLPGALGGIW